MFSAKQLTVQLTGAVGRWQVHSQQHALRNARLASTALARRRVERVEVEQFLATLSEERAESAAPTRNVAKAAHA